MTYQPEDKEWMRKEIYSILHPKVADQLIGQLGLERTYSAMWERRKRGQIPTFAWEATIPPRGGGKPLMVGIYHFKKPDEEGSYRTMVTMGEVTPPRVTVLGGFGPWMLEMAPLGVIITDHKLSCRPVAGANARAFRIQLQSDILENLLREVEKRKPGFLEELSKSLGVVRTCRDLAADCAGKIFYHFVRWPCMPLTKPKEE